VLPARDGAPHDAMNLLCPSADSRSSRRKQRRAQCGSPLGIAPAREPVCTTEPSGLESLTLL